jgi:hypothetical protein
MKVHQSLIYQYGHYKAKDERADVEKLLSKIYSAIDYIVWVTVWTEK